MALGKQGRRDKVTAPEALQSALDTIQTEGPVRGWVQAVSEQKFEKPSKRRLTGDQEDVACPMGRGLECCSFSQLMTPERIPIGIDFIYNVPDSLPLKINPGVGERRRKSL